MNSVATKDSYVSIENGKDITQVSCDKCCFVAIKFSTWDQPKEAVSPRIPLVEILMITNQGY